MFLSVVVSHKHLCSHLALLTHLQRPLSPARRCVPTTSIDYKLNESRKAVLFTFSSWNLIPNSCRLQFLLDKEVNGLLSDPVIESAFYISEFKGQLLHALFLEYYSSFNYHCFLENLLCGNSCAKLLTTTVNINHSNSYVMQELIESPFATQGEVTSFVLETHDHTWT